MDCKFGVKLEVDPKAHYHFYLGTLRALFEWLIVTHVELLLYPVRIASCMYGNLGWEGWIGGLQMRAQALVVQVCRKHVQGLHGNTAHRCCSMLRQTWPHQEVDTHQK